MSAGDRIRLVADGPEIARLRRELDAARADAHRFREERDDLRGQLYRAREDLQDLRRERDEALAEIARLRRELAEMTGCATHWCAEGGRSEREHRETLVRCRSAAQILIAEIGASGPEDVEETARRAVRRIEALRHELSEASAGCRLQARTEIALRRERDEAIAKFEILDDHRRADGELIDRIGASLRNLIASVTATKTRNTIVLRDIEAARAVLGDGK